MIILTFTRCSKQVLNSKHGSRHNLPLITCLKSACLQMHMKSTSIINKNQKSCLTGLFKLFVACSIWRILKHSLNHILHCHLLKIFELFQGTSAIRTFTLLIKTNAQLHLKMVNCNFYFWKKVTDFRHIILQLGRKFKSSFMEGVLQIHISSLQASLSCLTLFFLYYDSYSGL